MAYARGSARIVEVRDQIINFRVVLERLKAMCESSGHIELMAVCSRKLKLLPMTEGFRARPQVNNDIVNSAVWRSSPLWPLHEDVFGNACPAAYL